MEKIVTIKELREKSGMSPTVFSTYFEIPYRTLHHWEAGTRECPPYLMKLIEYKLINEGFINNEEDQGNQQVVSEERTGETKEINGRYKTEYPVDALFTNDRLKTSIQDLLTVDGFLFDHVELTDDISLFDGGARLACSVVEETEIFIEKNLNDEITKIAVFGHYNGTKVCLIILKDKNLVIASCRENIDISALLSVFCKE